MSAEIIPFDFEEHAVRVVMRDDNPWFVAADVCRVLEIGNSRQAVSRLDDDERDVISNDTLGGAQKMTAINESGLYALVLTSRKEQARRFRKWITAEVLPAIRSTGRYEHPTLPETQSDSGSIAGLPMREAELWLQMVREARLTRGTHAALSIWGRSPLPQIGDAVSGQGHAALAHLLSVARPMLAEDTENALTEHGLRRKPEGLFVANFALSIFDGTPWAKGAHRDALISLSGVAPYAGVLSLGRVATRGVIVPWALINREVV